MSVPIQSDRGKGVSCEISVTEITFEIDSEYWAGEAISITLMFPSVNGSPLLARCSGHVLRVEPSPAGWRIDATIERFTFSGSSSS